MGAWHSWPKIGTGHLHIEAIVRSGYYVTIVTAECVIVHVKRAPCIHKCSAIMYTCKDGIVNREFSWGKKALRVEEKVL